MKLLKTILIVDDDEIFVYLTRKAIEQAMIVEEIKVFGNGRDAINFLKENAGNPHLLPEIILLDLSMPIMDGWQFLEEFHLIKPRVEKKIIIYIVTSSISPEDITRAKSFNEVSDYIIKPITKQKLIEVVKNIYPGH
ncbi:response regulator [Flavobacterium sp. GT3R68]|uniref:response regulator n=1 Tax=Flavobacterium sp. GT3R68 TaxID=2594437 RepID=UPI000F88C9CD|nr:response regulator [Flavobacterium sp. GT3R68]RTY95872.1 response regulator [Flavobacterium sp. GSN2]TRW93644.1 response regulator [Flavobacterium sp. GT3R68]